MVHRMLVLALLLIAPSVALAQVTPKVAKKKPPERPEPTVKNYKYADDKWRQQFDFWQAKSDKPTPVVLLIHGGGWLGGDKLQYGKDMIKPFLDAGISVAAVDYRFITEGMEQNVEPPVKASLLDAARALQTIRSKAKEWNIDPTRIGATGSSAGACTSLWLALHDDMAKPDSIDPIERESTRLTCAAVQNAQTSLDPLEVRKWISNAQYGGHAFGFKKEGRDRPEEFQLLVENREKLMPWIKEYSPIEWVSKDDPPIYMAYPKQKQLPSAGQKEPDPTHSAMYGVELEKTLKENGVEVTLTYPGHEETEYGSMAKFLIEKLTAKE